MKKIEIVYVLCSRWGCKVQKPADKMVRFGNGLFCCKKCRIEQVANEKQLAGLAKIQEIPQAATVRG